jgi:hypothetical protein
VGKHATILYLGDHDPSGFHIEEKLKNRLMEYAENRGKKVELEVKRLALTHAQVSDYHLPPSPIKMKAQKVEEYRREFGDETWELDSLEPDVIPKMVEDAIKSELNLKIWRRNRTQLKEFKQKAAHKLKPFLGSLDE